MENIYIITIGDYSDYSIVAVFSTEEKANEYIQQNGDECRIEVYNIDKEVKRETKLWEVCVIYDSLFIPRCVPALEIHKKDDLCFFKFNGEYTLYLYIESDSLNKAKKIAGERAAQIKANELVFYRKAFIPYKDKYGLQHYHTLNYHTGEIVD